MSVTTVVYGIAGFGGLAALLLLTMPMAFAAQMFGLVASNFTVIGLVWKAVLNRRFRDVRVYYRKYHYEPGDKVSPVIAGRRR
ncbi:MAG: hypothetical protein U5N86_02830 [Planctomycetota bacterium]|nr:hypothetical protein [Planctomycetota bacterium]